MDEMCYLEQVSIPSLIVDFAACTVGCLTIADIYINRCLVLGVKHFIKIRLLNS